MENNHIENAGVITSGYIPVSVKPDKDEKRQIRAKYFKAGLVILLNIVIMNIILQGVGLLIGGLYSKEMTYSGMANGLNKLYENTLFMTVYSIIIPIISEIVVIILGIRLFKLDFKGLLGRENYNSATITKLLILSLGLQTAAAILTQIIAAILKALGVNPALPDLSVRFDSAAANVLLYSYACILGPILEELLYRGVLLQSLRKYNERMAIFVSALIFGLMHQNYQQFLLGFMIGIPMAIVTIKCGSLIPTILTHIFINTSSTILNLLMAYISPAEYEKIMSGSTEMTGMGQEMTVVVIISGIFRIGVMIAALIIGIIELAKGKRMSKPTPAGKSRGVPLLMTSWIWLLIFAYYIFINFAYPFLSKK